MPCPHPLPDGADKGQRINAKVTVKTAVLIGFQKPDIFRINFRNPRFQPQQSIGGAKNPQRATIFTFNHD